MRPIYAACVAACVGLMAAAGCGTGDDLFSEGNPLDGAGAGGTTDGANSSSSNSSSSSTSSNMATSSSSTSSNSGAAGPTTTSTGGNTGSGGDGTGAGPNPDQLDCGPGLSCDADTEACCWDQHNQHGSPQAECVMGESENDGCTTGYDDAQGYETRIECQTEAQCGNDEVCCARLAYSPSLNNNVYVELHCAGYDDCVDPGGGEFRGLIVCDDLGSTDGCPIIENPQGPGQIQSVCKDSQLLPDGYAICGTP